jgi:hypothetical protein
LRCVDTQAFDAADVSSRIVAAGLVPMARIHAFRDNIVPRTKREMAVTYYQTPTTWLDNSPELGGRAWLNPYSAEAQAYITQLAVELAQKGFRFIAVDSVQFPTGMATEKAGYGAGATLGRSQALQQFMHSLQDAVQAKTLRLFFA